MIIYNVTITLESSIEAEWNKWMQNKHIKEVLATGKFKSARMTKVLSHQQENQVSYSIQYMCENKETLDSYYKEDAANLRTEGVELFGEKMLAFRTELELVGDYFVNEN